MVTEVRPLQPIAPPPIAPPPAAAPAGAPPPAAAPAVEASVAPQSLVPPSPSRSLPHGRATQTSGTSATLHVEIDDNGKGIGDDGIGDGLGTQIVRTLVEGELSGTITWEQRPEGGTRVVIEIPLRFLDA
jgi:signal transduction histidine kinase